MHKIFPLLILVVMPVLAFSQGNKKGKSKSSLEKPETAITNNFSISEKMYENAMNYGDYEVARVSLYHMMAEQPENFHLKDSLSRIYLAQGYYHIASKMAQEVILIEPDNQNIMEVNAISLQAIGNLKESADTYEKLFKMSSNLQHGYQLAVIQYNLQRFGECNTTTDIIIANESSKTQTIFLNYGETGGQEVSLRGACHNLKGVMHRDLKQIDKAKAEFEAAIGIDAKFELAIQNLESLKTLKE